MTAQSDALVARIRAVLPSGRTVREVPMFGGTAIMLDELMLVSAGRDGSLLVRIDPTRYQELLQRTGARPSYMGKNRPMGPGWLTVDAENLREADDLSEWSGVALEYHATAIRNAR
jgi:TfoX/Sxy family transcriptional regulator of competence genes